MLNAQRLFVLGAVSVFIIYTLLFRDEILQARTYASHQELGVVSPAFSAIDAKVDSKAVTNAMLSADGSNANGTESTQQLAADFAKDDTAVSNSLVDAEGLEQPLDANEMPSSAYVEESSFGDEMGQPESTGGMKEPASGPLPKDSAVNPTTDKITGDPGSKAGAKAVAAGDISQQAQTPPVKAASSETSNDVKNNGKEEEADSRNAVKPADYKANLSPDGGVTAALKPEDTKANNKAEDSKDKGKVDATNVNGKTTEQNSKPAGNP